MRNMDGLRLSGRIGISIDRTDHLFNALKVAEYLVSRSCGNGEIERTILCGLDLRTLYYLAFQKQKSYLADPLKTN